MRFAPAVELLCTIPGVGRRAAEVIIAETSGDVSAFPTAKHLASWAGMCSGNDESAGKRRSGKTRKGSKWLSQSLVECAKSANRSKNTYLAAQYARLRPRRGANKATIAVCHSILGGSIGVAASPWRCSCGGCAGRRPPPDRGRVSTLALGAC